ncbi:5-formyltetrahydrofolate cyclo-ligase [Streptomyces sp. TP-A0874]|uniref:5-formyltetrahydrofolate cyclo-ligase n=1 Tax=Streptomyces sp. TP-A0874 TaxID=549819 RepID=UPI000853DE4A|nr:5-formyltetrahydrofolate cyclo-ligase [Streptomyces sp. TP-A0874]
MTTYSAKAHVPKAALRRDLLLSRSRLTPGELARRELAITERALDLPELATARTVAGYVSMGEEPGTRTLLEALLRRGTRVLLPVLLPDNDLDWAEYSGDARLLPAARFGRSGLREPGGPRLGREAVREADALLLPGLAVDERGLRLGRGGGSYDRVLARLAEAGTEPALLVLLHEGEVLPEVPAEEHDQPVRVAVTPSGVHRFRTGRPRLRE